MFVGISKTLIKMGGFRLHLGLNMKKWYTWLILFFVAIFYVMYYIMLGILWAIYGIAWCVYQLGRLWLSLFRRLQKSWQKGALVGSTALLVLILAIVGAVSGSKTKTPPASEELPLSTTEETTFDSAYALAESLFDDSTDLSTTSGSNLTEAIVSTTATPTTTTTTTKPISSTTTTTTTKPTTTTTTTKPTTTTTTKQTTSYQVSSETYILNTNTHKFHHAWCSSVGDIEPQNKATTDNRDWAIANGYQPCKRCNP